MNSKTQDFCIEKQALRSRSACFIWSWKGLGYAYLRTPEVWRFSNRGGEEIVVRTSGPLRANNADALMPALLGGIGLAVQPEFLVRDEIAVGRLQAVLPSWSLLEIALHLVMPSGGPRPARVDAFADFLTRRFSRSARSRS